MRRFVDERGHSYFGDVTVREFFRRYNKFPLGSMPRELFCGDYETMWEAYAHLLRSAPWTLGSMRAVCLLLAAPGMLTPTEMREFVISEVAPLRDFFPRKLRLLLDEAVAGRITEDLQQRAFLYLVRVMSIAMKSSCMHMRYDTTRYRRYKVIEHARCAASLLVLSLRSDQALQREGFFEEIENLVTLKSDLLKPEATFDEVLLQVRDHIKEFWGNIFRGEPEWE